MQNLRDDIPQRKPTRVLFVCLGNICRSPAAQGVMQRLVNERNLEEFYEIDSAGTYGGHSGQMPDRRMRVHARQRGYELTHRARQVTPDDLEHFDVIVGMDAANVDDLQSMAYSTGQMRKVVNMGNYIRFNRHYDHVPDPYYEGSEGFELVLDLLEDACECLLQELESERMIIHQ